MRKALLIVSLACMIFLLSLQVVYYFSLGYQIIQILGELLTIPSMLFVIFAFFFSLINVFRKKKEYLLILGINTFTVATCVAATILDYN